MNDANHDSPTDPTDDGGGTESAHLARRALRHPAVWGPLLVLAGAWLFGLGQGIGASFHDAFGGDTGAAVLFGAGLLAVVAVVVGLGVLGDRWLGRRSDDGDDPATAG